jgi:hypothetical protein
MAVSMKRPTLAPKTGSVKVSFAGLSPRPRTYRTLATRADIESVSLYLRDTRTVQPQHLDRQALERPRVELAFKSVATGPITLRVEAHDSAGKVIGETEQDARLGSGENLVLNLKVALIDSGNVGAVIEFVDGAPATRMAPPSHPCLGMFQNGEDNQDGKLTYDEWMAGNMVPPVPNTREIFRNHDEDGDGFLSARESCGAAVASLAPGLPVVPPGPVPVPAIRAGI